MRVCAAYVGSVRGNDKRYANYNCTELRPTLRGRYRTENPFTEAPEPKNRCDAHFFREFSRSECERRIVFKRETRLGPCPAHMVDSTGILICQRDVTNKGEGAWRGGVCDGHRRSRLSRSSFFLVIALGGTNTAQKKGEASLKLSRDAFSGKEAR